MANLSNTTTVVYDNSPTVSQSIFSSSGNVNTQFLYSCGYQGDVVYKVPYNQLIVIQATSFTTYGTIYGVLQKEFSLETASDWENFIPSLGGETDKIFQAIASLVAGASVSTVNPITSRRMWKSTTPLKLSLDIQFTSINNTQREVVAPCLYLQQLALPASTNQKIFGVLPLLAPPGPSPVDPTQGDQISIKIGNLLTFSRVIVKNVKVAYDNNMDGDGLPVSANVNVEFETYEIYTKTDLANAMHYGNNSGAPNVTGTGQSTIAPTTPPQVAPTISGD